MNRKSLDKPIRVCDSGNDKTRKLTLNTRDKDARPTCGMKSFAKCLVIHHPLFAKRCAVNAKNGLNH
jgi:hypothetical protein